MNALNDWTHLASGEADVLLLRQRRQDDLDAGRELFRQPVELSATVGAVELVERVEEQDERLVVGDTADVEQELLRQRLHLLQRQPCTSQLERVIKRQGIRTSRLRG